MENPSEVKVWDPLVRVFHWALVAAFAVAYLTEEEWMSVHSFAGYVVLGLVVIRLVWGFIGSRHARFADFVRSPTRTIAYLKDLVHLRARRYLGHNPAGGLMIVLLLVSLLATTFTGIAVYGMEDGAGPLAAWVSGLSYYWEDVFEETHELFANFTLLLVFIHVAGVVVESLVHRESLVRAMFTGRKPLREGE